MLYAGIYTCTHSLNTGFKKAHLTTDRIVLLWGRILKVDVVTVRLNEIAKPFKYTDLIDGSLWFYRLSVPWVINTIMRPNSVTFDKLV